MNFNFNFNFFHFAKLNLPCLPAAATIRMCKQFIFAKNPIPLHHRLLVGACRNTKWIEVLETKFAAFSEGEIR